MTRLALQDVHLTFTLRTRGSTSWKDQVLRKVMARAARFLPWHSVKENVSLKDPPVTCVHALRGVSFEVGDRERLGVIGHNGAGKSTLLRVLAGIYHPTAGKRLVEGRISSLFELGLGFESEATGWENIRYRGYLQKETPTSIREKAAAVAEFSELGSALDMPIRYYSSGMLVRLAFGIATAIEPEILLIDEVLAAGDLSFQEKARRRMRELMGKARAIVLVSHDLKNLVKLCDRVLWMEHGQIRQQGPPEETIAAYEAHMMGLAGRAA